MSRTPPERQPSRMLTDPSQRHKKRLLGSPLGRSHGTMSLMNRPAAFTASALFFTLLSSTAFAADKVGANEFDMKQGAMVGAGIAIGLAVLSGGIGQGRAAGAALEGISRN